MSRIRIVKGIYNKITHGDHQMFSKENINSFADSVIAEKGAENGVTYGSPQSPPAPEVIAKCRVEFRPNKAWQGDFGFDWDRKNDSKMPVDITYDGIIGSYGARYATQSGARFTADHQEYLSHRLNYKSFSVNGQMYYTPNMTLAEGATAQLDAVIHVDERPDKLHFAWDTELFQLTILTRLTTTKGNHYNEKVIEIKCLKAFNSEQSIRLIATKNGRMQKVGQINILANHRHRNVNVIFVPVKDSLSGNAGSVVGIEKLILTNALKQTYTNAHIVDSPQIKAGGTFFERHFIHPDRAGNRVIDLSTRASLHDYLDSVFFASNANKAFKDYYRVYMLPRGALNGVAAGIGNTKVVAVFQSRNKSTSAHELLHAMGLYHSFDNSGKFTFQLHQTDNIMDYTHQIGKERFSTNKWQWKIINPSTG